MARTDNVKKNLIFNVFKFATQLVLQFVLRTVLIYTLGAEYIGLNGLFSNIFNFLNLAELGIGSAIVFSMYKPIAEEDTDKIITLQNLYKKFYLIISIIVLIIGGILTPFLNIFIKGAPPSGINLYLLYVMYLINAVLGYFSAHKRSLLLAYQRNDIENKIKIFTIFAMSAIQIVVLIILKNYYLYFTTTILFTLVDCVLIHVCANRMFPNINGHGSKLDDETKKNITKNVSALSLHKIGSAVVFATDSLIISTLFGITVLGAYSNYALILTSLTSLFSLLVVAFTGSVGNLVASTTPEYTKTRFNLMNFSFSVLSGFSTICLFVLFQPFIKIWTGGGLFLLDWFTVFTLCVSFYLSKMRLCVLMVKECAGLLWQDRWKPIIEALVNLVVSILLGRLIGLVGVFIGTIASTLIAPFWVEPYVLYKYYFKTSVWEYWKKYIMYTLVTIIIGVITCSICEMIPDTGIWMFLARVAACLVISVVLYILLYYKTSEFKYFKDLFKKMLRRM